MKCGRPECFIEGVHEHATSTGGQLVSDDAEKDYLLLRIADLSSEVKDLQQTNADLVKALKVVVKNGVHTFTDNGDNHPRCSTCNAKDALRRAGGGV